MSEHHELIEILTGDFALSPQHTVRIDRAIGDLAGDGGHDRGRREVVNPRTGQKEIVLLDEAAASPSINFDDAMTAIRPLVTRLKFLNLAAAGSRFIVTLDTPKGMVEGQACNTPARALCAAVLKTA